MGQASKLALRASMSLAATGATGSYPARLWRLCVMAAALSLASAALAQGATAVRQLASPALAVKAGRQRGLSVLEKRRQEEQQEMAAAEAAAAKRKKIFRPTASVKVFPVEHFGVDLRGESASPCAPSGPVFFLPEVREFIKDTRPKTNTTRGGRKAHRAPPYS